MYIYIYIYYIYGGPEGWFIYIGVLRYMYRIDAVRGTRGTAWVAVRGTKVLMKRGTRYVGKGSYSKILNNRHPLAQGC